MSSNLPKKVSPSKPAPSTSQSTQQQPLRQQPVQSTPKSQSYPPQQQQQAQPDHPWSVLRPTYRSKDALPSASRSPYGQTLSITAAGELLFFGGPAHCSLHNDLYVFSMRDRSLTFLQTSGDVPSTHFSPAGVLVSNVLLIFGGVTKFDNSGFPTVYDNSLYQLSLVSREWIRVVVSGPRPVGRVCHAVTVVGSELFVFGGDTGSEVLNDMWSFELNSLSSNPVWNSYEPAPGVEKPSPRAGHVLVTTGDRIILFGGANDEKYYFNDTWSFDVSTRKWTELRCTGCVPSPRYRHTASLIDDVMYVFGGRVGDGPALGDLIALKLSTQQWFTMQIMGPSPTRRWAHAMVSNGTRLFLHGGISETGAAADESEFIHVLETEHIEIPKTDLNAVKHIEITSHVPKKEDNRLLAQTSLVEQKDAELAKMQAKLDELVQSRDQHVRALEKARRALQKATSRAADADKYEIELAKVRAESEARKSELEARKSELEAIRLRLTDAEIGWAKSKTQADTLRALNTTGHASTDEDRIARRLLERMRAMEAEMASLRWSEKNFEEMETRNEG